MPMFSRMKVHCPICRCQMDGMRGYGRDNANCCGKTCYDEWEWRKTLAIMGKPYSPQPGKEERPHAYDDGTVGNP